MRLVVVFGFIASVFSPLVFAHGYDSLVRHDLATPANLTPLATATTSDGGVWFLASGDSDQHQLVRLDANGNRTVGLFLPSAVDSDDSNRFAIYPLADGGVLELDTRRRSQFESGCILRSVTREGVLRFERNVRQSGCRLKISKLGRAPYLLTNIDAATLLSEDGSLASIFEQTGDASLIRAEFVAARDLLLLQSNESRTGYVLSRANDAGQLIWSNPLENVRFDQNVTLRGLDDGRALLIISEPSKLQIRLYSAAGSLTETREITMPEAAQVSFGDWSADGLGNQALALRFEINFFTNSYGAILFAPNAAVLKQIRYAPSDQCTQDCPLLGLAQGFANALGTQTGGKLVLTSLLPNVANTEVILPGSFNARIANSSNATILMTSDAELRAFNAAGVEIATSSLLDKSRTQPKVLAAAIADDGKSFVLQQVYDGQSIAQIQAFAANGVKLWQRNDLAARNPRLWANSARICLGNGGQFPDTGITFACFASATGAELVKVAIPNVIFRNEFPSKIGSRVLADSSLRTAYVTANGVEIIDITNDNQIRKLSIALPHIKSIIDIGATGSVLLTATIPGSPNVNEWVAMLANGQLAFRRTNTGNSFNGQFGRMLENDNVLLIASNQNSLAENFDTTLISRNGVQLWSVLNSRISQEDEVNNVFIDAKNAYLLSRVGGTLQLQALSLNSGASIWKQNLKGEFFSTVDILASANPNALLIPVTGKFGVQLSQISSINGAIQQQRLLDCAAADCTLRAKIIDTAGNFRSVSEAKYPSHAAIALGRTDIRASAPEIGLDQSGLSGGWYSPQISGQGFFVEYFPQSRLLFAPWFTFAASDGSSSGDQVTSDSVAQLRWYTLSGIVEPGANVARLEIRRNDSGVFNSAPITQSTLVGMATLRAQDCNRATLEFEFIGSEAEGKYGVLPLDRLTGGSAPCQLSNGQTLPGRDARPARGGFDGRQSGSWYQPTTAGQGINMTIQPATASAPGFFFGGWFTYDAGTPNDPTSQHWLTLSGEIRPDAQAGVVPVKIYRTLGGQLASVPTQNTTILGEGTVTFSGCSAALLRYQFDDAPIAGTFRARSGEISLQRLGACPPQ